MKINILSGLQELVDSISATCDKPCIVPASRETFVCVAISASPPAEASPPPVGDTLRASARDSDSEEASEYQALPDEWEAEQDRELQEQLALELLLDEVQSDPPVEDTLRSSTNPATDEELWRGLPYQTLACIYSTIIEFVDMKRGPDAIAVCDLGFPSWHR